MFPGAPNSCQPIGPNGSKPHGEGRQPAPGFPRPREAGVSIGVLERDRFGDGRLRTVPSVPDLRQRSRRRDAAICSPVPFPYGECLDRCSALSGRSGRYHCRYAEERRDRDGDSADEREGNLPAV